MIAPSILNADNLNLEHEIQQAAASGITRFHIDIMDGHFVPNLSFGPELVKDFKKRFPEIEAEVHLMSDKPSIFVPDFVKNGADLILLHYEAMKESELQKWIHYIKAKNLKVGIAINPDTSFEVLEQFLTQIDQVLVMSVFPGFGGQRFISEISDKIKALKAYMKEHEVNIPIEVDGGIDDITGKVSREAGANILVAGSFIFAHRSVSKQIKKLKDL